jgi:DNA-binding NarL/FixJ family response regulator
MPPAPTSTQPLGAKPSRGTSIDPQTLMSIKNLEMRARVVVDRFFGGLTVPEISEALGISERSVARHWAIAKVWLQKWVDEAPRSIQQIVA